MREDVHSTAADLVEALCKRAVTVVDPAMRVQLFRSMLSEVETETLRGAMEALVERAGLRDTAAEVALLASAVALAQDFERLRSVTPRPRRHDGPKLSGEEAWVDLSNDPIVQEEAQKVPDYGRGRVLSLGERKSIARRPERKLLDRVLRDPHPAVIELLLANPRLTEPDVVRMCARRPGVPEVLLRVFQSPKWSASPRVRRALAMNPFTPSPIVAAAVPLMAPADLREVAHDERVPPPVRRRCLELLARMPPHREDASGMVH